MNGPCMEVVTYRVHNPETADVQRRAARDRAGNLAGFVGWLPLSGAHDRTERVDIVTWASLEDARNAAAVVGESPDFAGFRESISRLDGMAHFSAETRPPVAMAAAEGMEIGRFHLKPGVSEDAMRKAHERMVARHLCRLPGWRGQRLVRLQDGSFLDLAFADSQESAIRICDSWQGDPDCAAFLALIEPAGIEFGQLI
ncbi:hypothetical protein [Stappia sp. MMSF_3263]|uniref:hypothetical protein n=1 Tax=Stappia sp. MMSF_3263 TaxID=3046693 RepID=UPI00273D7DC3|nr:hypothetical protein [Stappia sp. MMSF_3263]